MVTQSDYDKYKNHPLTYNLLGQSMSKDFCPVDKIYHNVRYTNYLTSHLYITDTGKEFSDISFSSIPICDVSFQRAGADASNNGRGGCCVTSEECSTVFNDVTGYNKHDTGIFFSIAQNLASRTKKNIDLCRNYVDTYNTPSSNINDYKKFTFLTMNNDGIITSNNIDTTSDI